MTNKKCYDSKQKFAGKIAKINEKEFIMGNNELVIHNDMLFYVKIGKIDLCFSYGSDRAVNFIGEDTDFGTFKHI